MIRLGQAVLLGALCAVSPSQVAAQQTPLAEHQFAGPEGSPSGLAAAAAAACDNSVSRAALGGGKIKRYKLTYLYALTEYNTGTCAANGSGSWALNSQQKCDGKKNCGRVTFGTLTGLHLGNGDCQDHTYDFAAICYTWTTHSNAKIDDQISATWHPPTLPDQPYQFPVQVPIVYPNSESVAFNGWDPQGYGKWQQTIHSDSDPSFDWSLNTVQETDPGTGSRSNDTCWCKGSQYDPFWRITGGTWFPDDTGVWGDDFVGWGSTYTQYYRQKRRAACGTTFPQQMQFQATNVSKRWVNYGTVNTLGSSFTDKDFTSLRAGHSMTEPFMGVPRQSRLACTHIAWPGPPSAMASAGLGESVTVNDPRPVAAAIEEIEQVSGKAITYEDPPIGHPYYMTPMVKGGDEDSRLLVPKGGSLRFVLPTDASASAVVRAVRAMVASYNSTRAAATFAVSQNRLTHVVPRQAVDASGQLVPVTPVLDAKITLAPKPRSAMELLGDICRAVSAASGQSVVVGAVPINALRQQQTEIGAGNEAAREVLANLLAEGGLPPLSWRLLYDPGMKDYALNLALVR